MSKKSKSGSGNMILLAGLGAGALLLFAGKSKAATNTSVDLPVAAGDGTEIPDAPKILAVNSQSTESPLPTGIVSDEEGMEVTSAQSTNGRGSSPRSSSSYSNSDDGSSGDEVLVASGNASAAVIQEVQEYNEIPPLVSTKLTPKEKDIIDHGKLSTALAVKRPDLYKAAYIKRYGGKTQAGKKKALAKATAAINAAAAAAKAAKDGGLVKAVKYPAKPEFTFVQSSGGMAAQVAMAQMAALQKGGVKVSPAAGRPVVHHKAVKGSKGKHPVKKTAAHPARAAHPAHPAKKHPAHPVRHTSTRHVVKKKH